MLRYRISRVAGRKNWHIVWTKGGTTKRKTTGTQDKEEAQAALQDFEDKQGRSAITATVTSVVDAYVEARTPEVQAPETIKIRAANITRIFKRLLVRHINHERCNRYIRRRRGEGVQDGTIRSELNLLSTALR